MSVKDLEIYNLSLELGSISWVIFKNLPNSLKFSLGDQLCRACDSVGANIAEGYGRFHYRDSLRFYYFARGSLSETLHWFELLRTRNELTLEEFTEIEKKIRNLSVKLNNFIKRNKESYE